MACAVYLAKSSFQCYDKQMTTPDYIRVRSLVLRAIRTFFDEKGFFEVQTPVLCSESVIDSFITPIEVETKQIPTNRRGDHRYFLQTSPELSMKRLLAMGCRAIYQIAPVFRGGERGNLHNTEFTMLEWYQCGDDYQAGIKLLAKLVETLWHQQNKDEFCVELVTFGDLFEKETGLCVHRASAAQIRSEVEARSIPFPDSFNDESAETWIDLLFSELIQPKLSAAIVYDFPAMQSQLARTRRVVDKSGTFEVAERFELYINGIELANGYHELLDSDVLHKRFLCNNRNRVINNLQELPVPTRLLEAMQQGFPPCSGTALGIDRLLMVLMNTASIDDVIAFPIEKT
ncbi:MAG: EF-P lysine aminoacylase EpmA [Thermoguttaceae bacterium]